MTESLDCQELVELVSDYLDDAMSPDERGRVDVHLAECDGCVSYIEQMRITIWLTGTLGVDNLEPAAMADLLAAFRAVPRAR